MNLLRNFISFLTLFYIGIFDEDNFVYSWSDTFQASRNCEVSETITQDSGDYDLLSDLRAFRQTDFCLYFRNSNPITISFTYFWFGFRDANNNCTSNFIALGDRQEVHYYPPPTRYCGSTAPSTFTSHSGFAWIWIHRSSFSFDSPRLRLHYSAPPACGGDISILSYTFLTSPVPVDTDITCEWTVSLRDNIPEKPLQIQVTNWSVTNRRTIVSIYDGKGGKLLAKFDETTDPIYVSEMLTTTTGTEVFITLFSEKSSTGYYPEVPFFNATVKVEGSCVPGTVPCGDGKMCYSESQMCDGQAHCSTAYDELGCKPCPPTEFWCGTTDEATCYKANDRCNGYKTCQISMQDEMNCKTCGPGAFLCKGGEKCIFERWKCDGDIDCTDGSDEEGCAYEASRRVITAAVIGSLICSLLLVIALGCTCKLYSLRASHHRHPHHHYRATPLTRVEREIFARRAPPTYDMTVSGVNTETTSTRNQRNRRRRSRRYQFQRTAPANVGNQANNNDNRQEGVEGGATHQANTTSQSTQQTPASSVTAQNSSTTDQTTQSALFQQFGSFLFESLRPNSQGQSSSSSSSTPRTSTPVPVPAQSSASQTTSNRNEGTSSQSSSSGARASGSSSSSRRQGRSSSSRSRRSSRGSSSNSTSSKDQQAKPLPKKKRILPVVVPAPCADVAVEEDTLACIYPCPPSYSQAVASGNPNDAVELTLDDVESSSNSVENQVQEDEDVDSTDQVFSQAEDDSLTTVTRSRFFPFSIGQALRSIKSASFGRFQRNPYLQMRSQDSRRNSEQDHASFDSTTDDNQAFIPPMQTRQSTSSDEDMLDCTFINEPNARTVDDDPLTSGTVATTAVNNTSNAVASPSGKFFPR